MKEAFTQTSFKGFIVREDSRRVAASARVGKGSSKLNRNKTYIGLLKDSPPPPPPWVPLFLASTVLWKLLKMIRDGKRNVNKDVQFSISKGVLSIIHSNKNLKYLKTVYYKHLTLPTT